MNFMVKRFGSSSLVYLKTGYRLRAAFIKSTNENKSTDAYKY